MASDTLFRDILESMGDGVMTIGLDGKILTFNAAAETILGLRSGEVLDRSFGEIFLTHEESDQFNQAVLNAVYEADLIHRKLVPWQRDGAMRCLEVTTSFLAAGAGGEKQNVAVIVAFTDNTEVKRLQEAEQSLSEELKEKHRELQKSYREMEATNANLQAALRKVKVIRMTAIAFAVILFVSIGIYTWRQTGMMTGKPTPVASGMQGVSTARAYTVNLQPLTDSITLKGTLKPIRVANVTSPFGGMVKELYFEYGQTVTKGQLLLKLDRAEAELKQREAKTAHIEAIEKVKELENWNDSNEMAKARQTVTRSKLTLDGYDKTFQETERLFKKEIVPATEYTNAKQQYTTAKMDYEAALRDFEVVKAKGEGLNRTIAQLKLDNARQKLEDVERQLQNSDIVAPVSGTILFPDSAGDKKGKTADRGVTFTQGEILLTVGNTEGLSMTAEVDELEVLKLKKEQEVRITGEAFSETIRGRVVHIASQASKSEAGKKTANFEVSVAIASLPEELREKLRLGMSVSMEIKVLDKPGVIMLPIEAVAIEGRDRVVTVRDRATQGTKKAKVETGITTLDAVEIIDGLKVGDEVVY
jgi:HlyD family secretion protein